MNKPEKRKLEKDSIFLEYDKGYNHAHAEWEAYFAERISLLPKKSKIVTQRENDLGYRNGRNQTIEEVHKALGLDKS